MPGREAGRGEGFHRECARGLTSATANACAKSLRPAWPLYVCVVVKASTSLLRLLYYWLFVKVSVWRGLADGGGGRWDGLLWRGMMARAVVGFNECSRLQQPLLLSKVACIQCNNLKRFPPQKG